MGLNLEQTKDTSMVWSGDGDAGQMKGLGQPRRSGDGVNTMHPMAINMMQAKASLPGYTSLGLPRNRCDPLEPHLVLVTDLDPSVKPGRFWGQARRDVGTKWQ